MPCPYRLTVLVDLLRAVALTLTLSHVWEKEFHRPFLRRQETRDTK